NKIELPSDIVILREQLSDLINFVYSNLVENSGNMNYMVGRAILISKNDKVEKIFDLIMNRLPGEVYTYYSADFIGLKDGN
ncbi:15083_t:CDS:1, partial [Acaulospora morrowiae]